MPISNPALEILNIIAEYKRKVEYYKKAAADALKYAQSICTHTEMHDECEAGSHIYSCKLCHKIYLFRTDFDKAAIKSRP